MENDLKRENLKFEIFGMSIENLSLSYGIFLILWGVIISFISSSNSLTSFIPSIIGLPIFVFSFLSKILPNRKKLFMHIVVVFILIIFLGGLDFLRQLFTGYAFENIWADVSKLMMLITGLLFLYACIKSFIFERKKKNLVQ
tara:strand:- start:93 stop:518 length:426 start_codon:yes stop_codon:yes gene_type:complete